MNRVCIAAVLGVCSAGNPLLAADNVTGPKNNPFSRPPSLLMEPNSVGETETTTDLILRATLLSPNQRLANIGGVIVGLGEQHAGFRLVVVNEDRVVIERDGERMELMLAERADRG